MPWSRLRGTVTSAGVVLLTGAVLVTRDAGTRKPDGAGDSPTGESDNSMPSYKTAFGSYLKQEDLQGKTPKVVIASVGLDDVKDDKGKTDQKLVMHFVGKDKALILNRTNCEALETITGTDDYGRWVGVAVVLYTDPTVMYGGKRVGGLRIRAATGNGQQPVAPPPLQPPPAAREPGEDDEDDIGF